MWPQSVNSARVKSSRVGTSDEPILMKVSPFMKPVLSDPVIMDLTVESVHKDAIATDLLNMEIAHRTVLTPESFDQMLCAEI